VALGGVDAGVAGVHELVAARVDADVAGLVDQVAGLGLGARDHSAGSGLAGGAAREVDAVLGVDPLDEAGAVPARRGGAAVHVGGADAGAGGGEDRAALGGGRRRCGALLLLLGGGGRGRGRGLLGGGLLGRGVVVAAGALLGAGGAVVVLTGLGALIGLLLLLLGLALGGALSGFALGGLGGGDLLLRRADLDGDRTGDGGERGLGVLGGGLGGRDPDGGSGDGGDQRRCRIGLGGVGLGLGGGGGGTAEQHRGGHRRAGAGTTRAAGRGHGAHGATVGVVRSLRHVWLPAPGTLPSRVWTSRLPIRCAMGLSGGSATALPAAARPRD